MTFILLLAQLSAEDAAYFKRVERYAVGIQQQLVKDGRVDRLSGLEIVHALRCAFLIHPAKEAKPKPLGKTPLADWVKSQNWRSRLVVMEFEDRDSAQAFIEGWFAALPKNLHPLKARKIDTTVVWGHEDVIEKWGN